MATVSRNLSRTSTGITAVITLGDKLGVVMKFLRAAERGVVGEISVCLQLYPDISQYVINPYLGLPFRSARAVWFCVHCCLGNVR